MPKAPSLHEFWLCPICKRRYWTLYVRQRLTCQGCRARCVPSDFVAYCQPDPASDCFAFVSIDDPESGNPAA